MYNIVGVKFIILLYSKDYNYVSFAVNLPYPSINTASASCFFMEYQRNFKKQICIFFKFSDGFNQDFREFYA